MVPESVASVTEVASAMMDSPVTTAREQRSAGHAEEAAERRAHVAAENPGEGFTVR